MRRLGLRARLAAALAAVALFAVALAALLGNLGLTPRLNEAARARLERSAVHAAGVAAALYQHSGGWSSGTRAELGHVAALGGLRIAVRLPGGQALPAGPRPSGATAQAPVIARGRPAGTVVVSAAGGTLLSPEERDLRHSLDQLHLAAAAAAALAAVLAGLLLAQTLSRPLRRIRGAAERLERGDLGARAEPGTEPEMRAVGHALNRLAGTLQQEEELRKAGVADLAHAFRTPVSGLLTRIEAAQDGVLPLPENLAAMHEEAQRLTRLLDDLARLADAERPGLLLARQPADLAEVARGSAQSLAARFTAAGIRLAVTGTPAWVLGDAARLGQIVSNLLSNALRYTDAGGEVTLSVGHSDGEAFLEVTDTGIGIAPGDLRHIYTRFWRGDRSRSRATGGTGIGLAIVRELVRAHDGRIDVDSAPGRGSRFRVTLPAIAPHPAPAPARIPQRGRQAPEQH
jgi:signal transduction histidine kinase